MTKKTRQKKWLINVEQDKNWTNFTGELLRTRILVGLWSKELRAKSVKPVVSSSNKTADQWLCLSKLTERTQRTFKTPETPKTVKNMYFDVLRYRHFVSVPTLLITIITIIIIISSTIMSSFLYIKECNAKGDEDESVSDKDLNRECLSDLSAAHYNEVIITIICVYCTAL